MNDIEVILRQLAKIATIDPTVVPTIATQLAKIAAQGHDITSIINMLQKVAASYPTYLRSCVDAFSDSQISSKQWIAEIVNGTDLGTIFMCGGWLATLLKEPGLEYTKCISIDLDPNVKFAAKALHLDLVAEGWKFIPYEADILDINYNTHLFNIQRANGTSVELEFTPDTIINTSCEHIEKFSDWWNKIPKGKLIIVQSNDGFDIPTHVNCVRNLDEFAAQTPMDNLIYQGSKVMPKFTRFMRVGYK